MRGLRSGLLVAGVLALHLWLITELAPQRDRSGVAAVPAPKLQVRSVVVVTTPPPAEPLRAAPALPVAPSPRLRAAAAPRPVGAAAITAVPALPVGPPTYRTLMPPPFAFAYDLQRGAESGSVELQWRTDGEQYEARLAATTRDGAPWLAWASRGGFDAAGLAPLRHTDRRRGRGTQAANFQRDAGRISFSGPSVEHPLPPGAQDRLSWMLQLAAIAAADPAQVGTGASVSIVVVGARGDADVWTFVHAGEEALDLASGSVQALHLRREPGHLYDTRAEVWLDPARHYLPVRARLANAADGNAWQIVLREVRPAPLSRDTR